MPTEYPVRTCQPGRKEYGVHDGEQEQTRKDFGEAVNMTASELEKWLGTDESEEVGDVEDSRWHHSLMNWGHDPLGK